MQSLIQDKFIIELDYKSIHSNSDNLANQPIII